MFRSIRRKMALLAGLAAAAAPFAATPASAILTFTGQNQILFSSQAVQSIVPKAGGGWRVYLTSAGVQVVSATSPDLVTWTPEAGVRLSTAASPDVDSSSITSCGVYVSTNAADPLRMFYVGVSSVGYYRILSATSTNGLTWSKEAGVRVEALSGTRFLDSPRPLSLGAGGTRLFFVADGIGGGNPANYHVYSATSNDGGVNLTVEGSRMPGVQAFQVAVTTLTDGRTRLYYSAPPAAGGAAPSQVLSAIATDGLTFTQETGVRLSTPPALATMSYPVLVRSTETWRWRMYWACSVAGSTIPFANHAVAATPVVLTMTPRNALKNDTNVPFTLTGEALAPADVVTLCQTGLCITATGVAAASDLQLTGTLNPFGFQIGWYDALVTDPWNTVGTLARALYLDIPPGTVSILDNLFRPLKGGSAKITTTTFDRGRVTLRLYTTGGALIATIFDGELPAGTNVVAWDGRTGAGNTVASGVYLLSVRGPKLDTIEKIVVIK